MRGLPCRPGFCFRQVSPEDRSALWALLTFYGGACQLSLNRKCTHLVVPEPKGVSAAPHASSAGVQSRGTSPGAAFALVPGPHSQTRVCGFTAFVPGGMPRRVRGDWDFF